MMSAPAPAMMMQSPAQPEQNALQQKTRRVRLWAAVSVPVALFAIGVSWGGYGSAAPGFMMGFLELAAVIGVCSLGEATCCRGCCCICPECVNFSNAFHLRNLYIFIFVIAAPSFLAPTVLGGILLGQRRECYGECVGPSWSSCGECGVTSGSGRYSSGASYSASYSSCCSSVSSQSQKGYQSCQSESASFGCDSYTDSSLQDEGSSCRQQCQCMGGSWREDFCTGPEPIHGIFAVLGAVGIIGIIITSLCTTTSLNSLIQAEGGAQGRAYAGMRPAYATHPSHPVAAAEYGYGQQQLPASFGSAAVIGQPVAGPLTGVPVGQAVTVRAEVVKAEVVNSCGQQADGSSEL
ncbi:unnamed protein product [Polarella glacialis]|uniref:Uncharacterized protein n=1 Tax=Polarella glacialis TaxID=89957 RepID=A0A813F3L4_POLGL|nr:unnamed protein product [Polarella glacialis]